MYPANILVKELKIKRESILRMERKMPENRNETWYCVLENHPNPIYLKIQGGERFSRSIRDESQVLSVLNGSSLPVPKLLAHGEVTEIKRAFLITEAIPGITLHEALPKLELEEKYNEKFFCQVIDWLQEIQMIPDLKATLLAREYIGVYHRSFNPIKEIQKLQTEISINPELANKFESIMSRSEAGDWEKTEEIVHGSLTTFNLLASPILSTSGHLLNGIIDFEATRIGNLMFDVATLAFYLLISMHPSLALSWISCCRNKFGERQIERQAVPLFLLIYLLRAKANQSNSIFKLPSTETADYFLHSIFP